MRVTALEIEGLFIIDVTRHEDERGHFSEVFRKDALSEVGFDREFIQGNQSFSVAPFTVRGLHFQTPPYDQDKLIRVTRGAIFDVAVDLRPGSPTYGRHIAVELSADNLRQLLVPRGFAHGFQTLTPECEVEYKITAYYTPKAEAGLFWNDPMLSIDWPERDERKTTVNARDSAWPMLDALEA